MRYYYGQLTKPLQGVYDTLLSGFRVYAPSIRIPDVEQGQLAEVYLRLKLDEPLLFYVTGYRCRWMPGAAHLELLPEYLFDKSKIRTHQQAIEARLSRLTRPLQGKPELEQELAIHDFILEQVRYDKLKKPYSHEILGPLTQGVGVCEGIAKTVKALCDQLGLWCIVALSEADPEGEAEYNAALESYCAELDELDAAFTDVVANGVRNTIVFGDRFPLLYFAKAYGLEYYAAWPGCADEAEPSAATVAFLIDKVNEEHIPVVFHIELSNEDMADTICEATGAEKLLFSACHNVTRAQFESGVTYMELMWDNVDALREALS